MAKKKGKKPMNLANLSREDLLLLLTRELLERRGETEVPMPRVKAPKRAVGKSDSTDWTKVMKLCPHCGATKPIVPEFGVRTARGIVGPQPWCKNCRATTNYYRAPRKNKTKHNPNP